MFPKVEEAVYSEVECPQWVETEQVKKNQQQLEKDVKKNHQRLEKDVRKNHQQLEKDADMQVVILEKM